MTKNATNATQPIDAIELLRNLDREQLQQQIAEVKGRLSALQILEKAIVARDGEQPVKRPRKVKDQSPKPPPVSDNFPEGAEAREVYDDRVLVKRIREYLRDHQPVRAAVIASQIGVASSVVLRVLAGNPDYFEKAPANHWRLRKPSDDR